MSKKIQKKEMILPQISFKYSSLFDENGERPRYKDKTCYFCGDTNIIFGGMRDAYSKNPKILCEECAIEQFAEDYGFETLEAATARRRRIFDVGYLFNEMFIDAYLKQNKKTGVNDLSDEESESLLKIYQNVFNSITKEEKERIENIVSQSDIEKELEQYLPAFP